MNTVAFLNEAFYLRVKPSVQHPLLVGESFARLLGSGQERGDNQGQKALSTHLSPPISRVTVARLERKKFRLEPRDDGNSRVAILSNAQA